MFDNIRKKINKKRQLYIWFSSYMFLLFVSLFISGYIYKSAIDIINDEIKRATESTLSNIQNSYDANFSNIQNMSYNILNSQYISNLATSKNNYSSIEISNMVKVVSNNIMSNIVNIKYVSNCFVMFEERDMCIDASGMYEKNAAYEKSFKSFYPTQNEWLNDMFNIEGVCEYKALQGGQNERNVVFIYKYPLFSKGKAKAVMVVNLNITAIKKELAVVSEMYNSQVFILDKSKELLFGANDYTQFDFKTKANSGIDKNNFITHIISPNMGWDYLLVVPMNVYSSKVSVMNSTTILIYFICLIIGILMAVFFSKINYKPLNKIVSKLKLINTSPNEYHEFDYIENAISDMVDDRGKMLAEISDSKEKSNETFLSKLVMGKIRFDKNNEALFKKHKIDIFGGKYIVVLFDIINKGILNQPGDEIKWRETNLIFFTISNVFSELMNGVGECSYFEVGDMYCCIANSKSDFLEESAFKSAETAAKFLKGKFEIEMVCAVSEVRNGGESLPELFLQAKEIMGMRYYMEDKSVLKFENLTDNKDVGYDYSFGTEIYLINLIKKGNAAMAKEVISKTFEENVIIRKADINIAKVLTYDISSTLLKLSVEVYPKDDTSLFLMTKDIMNSQNIIDSKNMLLDCTDKLCEKFTAKNPTVSKKATQVIELIHEKYSDPNFNVSYIANELNITINYLSRYFKEQTGVGPWDYIVKYRIEKACELLKNGDITVSDAGKQCGFEDVNVFIRAFKKIIGVTPGNYKN